MCQMFRIRAETAKKCVHTIKVNKKTINQCYG